MPPARHTSADIANHGERIASLEVGQLALQKSISDLTDIVAAQAQATAKEHAQTRKEINLLGDKIGGFGKPNYGVVISAASLVIVIGAAVLGPLQMQLAALKTEQTSMAVDLHAHQLLPIHPVEAARLEEREKHLDTRFASAEREAALQQEIMKNRIDAVAREAELARAVNELKSRTSQ
jgi:uncharacterized coiled-coil protein SlyX